MDTDEVVELADRGDLDGLLAAASLDAIADAWWRYTLRWDSAHRAGTEEPTWENDPDSWAEQVWQSGVMSQSEDTLRSFLQIAVERAPEEADLGYLGAGPIEDFVAEPDEDRLLWIERQVAESQQFRQALRNVEWRSTSFEQGAQPGTLVQKHEEPDPRVEAIIRRIESGL